MNANYERTPARMAGVEARLREAARRVEVAQHELERAAADLSSIVGGIPLWTKSARLSEQCHALWARIAYLSPAKRARLGLDHDPTPEEMRRYGAS